MQKLNEALSKDFSYLDLDSFHSKFVSGSDSNEMVFYVAGIRCSKCVRILEELPLKTPGLMNLRVDMSKSLAYAQVDTSLLSFSRLATRIAELGFTPIPVGNDTVKTDLQDKEDRKELIRLGVAAACAGNIMTFSFANYFGETAELFSLFQFLSFVLYLPVLTYVALPFYRGALSSLKSGQLSIDLPMAVASVAGFIFSTVQLFRGRADVYFDSLSGFLFLILVARWGQNRLQRRLLRPEELTETLELEKVRKLQENGWQWVQLKDLQIGDRILLRAHETVPAEAELISPSAHFGLAWITGEMKSKTFLVSSIVPAGAKLATGEVKLLVKKTLDQTGFGKILQEVQKYNLSKNKLISAADKWAQGLLTIVFVVAGLFLAAYWTISPEEAIRRSLALIILACPCALAFGTPLALATGLKRAKKHSLIVRDANIFEKLKTIDTIFFDKTGTLTDTDLAIVGKPENIPAVYQKIILTLELTSMHPIAFAFRKFFPTPSQLPVVDGFRETPGTGVSGFVFGKFYELRSNDISQLKISCTLFEDHQPIYDFSFDAQLRPDALSTLNELRERGYQVRLISGDGPMAVRTLAEKLNFSAEETYFESDPAQKQAIVSKSPNSMMVGDGVNDSLAMMQAKVSVAAAGGVEVALKNSDVYLASPSLKAVVELFDTADLSIGLMKQNLTISAIYNITGGTLALLGFINPLIAALLMPVSSGLILLSTLVRGRS